MTLTFQLEIEVAEDANCLAAQVAQFKKDLAQEAGRYSFVGRVVDVKSFGDVSEKQARIRELSELRRAAIASGLKKAGPR